VFPVTRRWAYCDHASVGPLPLSTRDAVVAALDAQTNDGDGGIPKQPANGGASFHAAALNQRLGGRGTHQRLGIVERMQQVRVWFAVV